MTHKKPCTLVRAALLDKDDAFASALARSQRPFLKTPDSPIRMPAADRPHRYYAWETGESGEAPYFLYAGQPGKNHRRYVGGNNVVVVATSWDTALSERLVSDFVEQTGIPLGNHLPENAVRMNIASMDSSFGRFVANPAEFLQMLGLAYSSKNI